MQIGGQENFAAELVRRACFAFADAFHFRRMPGIEITRIAAPLLGDTPSLAERDLSRFICRSAKPEAAAILRRMSRCKRRSRTRMNFTCFFARFFCCACR